MGSSSRLISFFHATWRRTAGFFRRSPLIAYPATGVAALAVCGILVWLIAFRVGSEGASDVLSAGASPTPRSTATATVTATATPNVTPTPGGPMQAAGATPGTPAASSGGSTNQGPAAESSMRFKIPSIGVDAPVTIRTIGSDGQMGAPNGRFDVVWYDFSAYAGMGGYPGDGGNAVFSGHVDYHPNYEAVFWDLRLVGPGDLIEVDLPNGTAVRYSVQWTETISPDADFSSYVTQTGQDGITIVTCQGTFNSATHNYDHRLVVRGVRIP
jgi:LPXTG-site transpeptidase (sortase) family protein